MIDHTESLFKNIGRYIDPEGVDKDLLRSLLITRKFLKRQYLLQEGDVCKYESFVVQGCFRTFFTDKKGDEHTLSFAIEDWWTSDLESFLLATPSMYNIEALEDSVVLQINKESIDRLYESMPAFERYFRILHQNAFIAQTKRILNNISLTGEEKYEAFLAAYPYWDQRIPQKYIASYLGITPVFLSQIRNQRRKK